MNPESLPETGHSPHKGTEVPVGPARSRNELEQAYRLVYQSYLQRGYVPADPSEIRVGLHNALSETVTFVGVLNDEVVATVSLVPDTPIGLPMDDIYHNEMQALRKSGRRVTEVTMLADRRRDLRRTLPMLLSLMKLVFDYATLVLKANDLCITINPRHESFYRRYLLFTDLGEERTYPSVLNNPALAKRLDLDDVREATRGNRLLERVFYTERTPTSVFIERYRMTCDDLHYFCVQLTSVLRDATPEAITYLRRTRTECPWEEWASDL